MAPSISNILQALHPVHLNIVDVVEGLYDLCDAKSAAAYLPPQQISWLQIFQQDNKNSGLVTTPIILRYTADVPCLSPKK